MSNKSADRIDKHVGKRIREAREAAGLSQTRIGEALGVSFQQIQKVERGLNRVSASRLYRIARITEQDIAWFFAKVPAVKKAA